MSRHNVRVRVKPRDGHIRNVAKTKDVIRPDKNQMFSKISLEKQALRERYIQLMNDAENSVGRKEAIYLLRDAETIWKKINS